jgi:DNA ligase 1
MQILHAMVRGTDVLQPEGGAVLDDPRRLDSLFEDALDRGLEGLVIKRVDSPYQAGARNFNWLK